MSKIKFPHLAVLTAALMFIWAAAQSSARAEDASAPTGDKGASLVEAAVISNQSTIRANLEIQEQLHDLKQADEKSRAENATAAQKLNELLNHRLDLIESSLATQGLQKLDDMRQATMDAQHSNQMMLLAAIGVACFGCLVLLLAAFLQWQTVNRVRMLTAGIGSGSGAAMLGSGDSAALAGPGVEQSTAQFLGAVERLERRIHEIEDRSHKTGGSAEIGAAGNGGIPEASASGNLELAEQNGSTDEAKQAALLMSKGQTLLKLDKAEPALRCFEEVLTSEPNHAEALLARGTALERLQRLSEAIECYDRAIASNRGMTMAYLHKGGVFNRMERYSEALECYEQALKCQEKAGGGEVAGAV